MTAIDRIRDVVETWAVSRDAGDWDRLRSTWHVDGRMNTTWFRGSASDFVEAARRGFEAGVVVHHFLGGTSVEISDHRAIAQTKMSISQRLLLDKVEVDVTCWGRFYDFFELRDRDWRMVLREPIYEKDRIDPVVMEEPLALDRAALSELPPGCRHLLYSQTRSGMKVHTDVPGLNGAAVQRLYASGRRWLAGEQLDR